MIDRSLLPRFASIHLDSGREVLRDRRVVRLSWCGKVTSDSPAFTSERREASCRTCRKMPVSPHSDGLKSAEGIKARGTLNTNGESNE